MCGTCFCEAMGPAKKVCWVCGARTGEFAIFVGPCRPRPEGPGDGPIKTAQNGPAGPSGSRRTGTVWLPMLQTTQTPWLHAVQNVVWMSLSLEFKRLGVRFPPGGVPLRGDACPILTVKPGPALGGRMSREPKSHPADWLPGPPKMRRRKPKWANDRFGWNRCVDHVLGRH